MARKHVLLLAVALVLMLSGSIFANDPITIRVGIAETWQQSGLDFIEDVLIPRFEAENPGIKVEMDVIRWSYDTYVTRYVAGEAPDAFQMGGDRVGTYVDMLEPLDQYVVGFADMSDFPPVLIDGWRVRGQLYGIPWSMPVRAFFYRSDYFLEAGLDPNTPPATWDDLIEYGRRLSQHTSDGELTRQGLKMSDHWLDVAAYLFQAGGDYMNEDRTVFTFGSEEAQEAAEFMRSTVQVYGISAPDGLDLGDIRENRTAMEIVQATILNEPEWLENIAIAPPITHREQVLVTYANGWGITNTSDHKDAAWKWIEFVSDLDNMVDYAHASLIMPPRMGVVNYEPWADDPRFQTLYASTLLAKGLPFQNRHIDQVRRDFIQPTFKSIIYFDGTMADLVEAERLANAYIQNR